MNSLDAYKYITDPDLRLEYLNKVYTELELELIAVTDSDDNRIGWMIWCLVLCALFGGVLQLIRLLTGG